MNIDWVLLERFVNGDTQAFDLLAVKYRPTLLSFFLNHGCNWHLAEDLTQETLLRLFVHASRYQPASPLAAYVCRIARNLLIDHLRRSRKEQTVVSLDHEFTPGLALMTTVARPNSDDRSNGALDRVLRVMAIMPAPQRTAFWRLEVEGQTYQAISDDLGVPLGTVKSRVSHARRFLRDRVRQTG
jgi:RNA polymerase sigma-70 factor, ECF subfamily